MKTFSKTVVQSPWNKVTSDINSYIKRQMVHITGWRFGSVNYKVSGRSPLALCLFEAVFWPFCCLSGFGSSCGSRWLMSGRCFGPASEGGFVWGSDLCRTQRTCVRLKVGTMSALLSLPHFVLFFVLNDDTDMPCVQPRGRRPQQLPGLAVANNANIH